MWHVGLTKMTYFAKLANLARIHQKGLAKNFSETTKEPYSQLAIFTKMTRIHQRFCKTSNEVAKREILKKGDYKKMANFGRKREISAKMASMRKSHRGFCQIFK